MGKTGGTEASTRLVEKGVLFTLMPLTFDIQGLREVTLKDWSGLLGVSLLWLISHCNAPKCPGYTLALG